MIYKDADGYIRTTEPPFFPPEVIEWYSEENNYGWIDSETADRIFPNGTWDQLGYKIMAEYTNPYGLVFTYIKKK